MAITQTDKTIQPKKKSPAQILKERKIASYQERIDHDKETISALEDNRDEVASADVVGLPVSHKTFGNGIITEQTTSSITVKFDFGNKRFIMPSAFIDGFLTTDNIEIIEKFNQYREMGEQIKQAKEDMSAAARSIQILEKK